ncbi:Malic acid transport protein [Lachnellula suecica]|uniref:Malic acid transport protein n=1 Tax=Lachnellula suecica TaxID=602035 RepID=A0A8T9C6Z0_9HELO|nr:Malic acid transport protein [Lachnellula suecica]
MALSNVGSLVLNILIFITTLVNFSYALTHLDALTLLFIYVITKVFVTPPDSGILAKSSLPRRMRIIIPENGYESPQCPGTPGNGNGNGKHRRMNGDTAGNGNGFSGGQIGLDNPQSQAYIQSRLRIEREDGDEKARTRKIGFRDRVSCYTWTWFTMTMATGGIANVLHAIPYRSDWLTIVGTVVFLFNLVLFLCNCILITLRFHWVPGSFKACFLSQSESLFIPASVVSAGTILINFCQYGLPKTGQWFQVTMQVCYWAYASMSVIASSGMYLIIWSTQSFPIHNMTPIWVFPAYPLLIVAPFAANLIDALPDSAAAARINSIAISFGAVCLQGTGFLVSLMIYSAFIYRLMTQKLPRETTRPGMFVSVGPSGFTAAGLVHIGSVLVPKIMPNDYMSLGNAEVSAVLKLLSDLVGLWLWGLCMWFFIVSLGAHWQVVRPNHPDHHLQFDMTWFSFVFPNSALVTATLAIGKSLDSRAIQILGTVLAVLLVLVWIGVWGMMIRALWLRRLLWPGEVDGSEASMRRWMGKHLGVSDSVTESGSGVKNEA